MCSGHLGLPLVGISGALSLCWIPCFLDPTRVSVGWLEHQVTATIVSCRKQWGSYCPRCVEVQRGGVSSWVVRVPCCHEGTRCLICPGESRSLAEPTDRTARERSLVLPPPPGRGWGSWGRRRSLPPGRRKGEFAAVTFALSLECVPLQLSQEV